jgi:microcompartment protein CcmK/EutM
MKLCRVTGNVYGAVKHPDYDGRKLLIVQPLTGDLRPKGAPFLAVDTARAGAGDLVLVMSEGNGVRQILGVKKAAIRSLIVGVVDAVDYTPNPS